MRRLGLDRREMTVADINKPDQPPVEDELVVERGEKAVLHKDHQRQGRGRRSILFPDINITATADRLGITKSHLAKVLTGQNKPSFELAKKIADVLQVDLAFVALLSHNVDAVQKAPRTKRKRTRTQNAKSYPGV